MAQLANRLKENADGDLFVDTSCIDCDLCRQIAPAVFARSEQAGQSYVHQQPADSMARHRALMALVTCPTASIGTAERADVRAAAAAFPEPLSGTTGGVDDDVYFCGFAAESSFGA